MSGGLAGWKEKRGECAAYTWPGEAEETWHPRFLVTFSELFYSRYWVRMEGCLAGPSQGDCRLHGSRVFPSLVTSRCTS